MARNTATTDGPADWRDSVARLVGVLWVVVVVGRYALMALRDTTGVDVSRVLTAASPHAPAAPASSEEV